ncbi:MAG: DUF4870 domain-containing protein [Planctomycetaceae bacterium]|nr:DUF4870 domain-containing protein [Planctomycetaceae bacterium]
MTNWYYYDQTGQKCGPIDSQTLKTLVQHGIITNNTIVETETGKSDKAENVKGLDFLLHTSSAPPIYFDLPAVTPSSQVQNSSVEGTLLGMEPNDYFMLMHLAGFVFFPAAIVLWAIAKDKDSRADIHGKHIFNWLLSLLIYEVIGYILYLIIISFFVIMAQGVCSLVFSILAAVKASKGEIWKYPYSIKFFSTNIP